MKLTEKTGLDKLLAILEVLRDEKKGCPWDKEQTLETLLPYTIEEAYEVADAILRNDNGDLCDELGDLLFQVVFYSQISKENDAFEFSDVVDALIDKLIRRHPHVFSGQKIASSAEQTVAWEAHKVEERIQKHGKNAGGGRLDGVLKNLPALIRSIKLQKRAATAGFDWHQIARVMSKVDEELNEVKEVLHARDERLEHELGDLLLAVTNLARHADIDPELALQKANNRFVRRFAWMERMAAEQGREFEQLTLSEMELLWIQAKQDECS
ncbi:MAG: nucleoside triphosphate pyrophosphohydrolase [Gammaproteobacteria bacterium]